MNINTQEYLIFSINSYYKYKLQVACCYKQFYLNLPIHMHLSNHCIHLQVPIKS